MTPRTAAATAAKSDLSRAAIVERALSLMDVDGPDAVTIRRIAQEFGVTPMALYWHVANKDELLAAMGDALLADVVPPPVTGSWSVQLRGVVENLIESLSRHPAAADLVFPRILVTEPGLQITEFTLALLEDAGFSREQAADLARMGLQTALMLVTQRPGAESQAARKERDALLAQKRAHVESLPSDRYPHVRAAAVPLTDCDDEAAYYSFGVDLYIEGAVALMRKVKRASA
ncbi:MAG TPA: TetR family transcriptional regulator [Nocardioides sp.]|uniref:TetR family transcriptional regulator n=1 Tax=Nocardioides sp. TaxID=35761 RepID=UPI002F3EB163